jgi:hypothetical protein
MSAPDEDELKEIEEETEHSALDHEYWESKAFLPLEEPEYTAGESGRVHWSIDAFNGTRENPNHELVMKSEVVTIGGHQWQIKFYPKGNDTDYLSVYLECLSVMDKKNELGEPNAEEAPEEGVSEPKKQDKGENSIFRVNMRTYPISRLTSGVSPYASTSAWLEDNAQTQFCSGSSISCAIQPHRASRALL